MKKFMILASVVAIVVAALALPALAQSRSDEERQAEQFAAFLDHYFYGDDDDDRWEDNNWWKDHEDKDWWNDHEDNDWWNDHDDDDDDFDKVGAPVVNQESSQEAQSGDIDQSFTVTNSGDNSNQCAGVQGVANTGNAQNQISVVQNGSEADDFSFEDSGSSIEVNPTNYTSCDQQVNQAASAAYYGGW